MNAFSVVHDTIKFNIAEINAIESINMIGIKNYEISKQPRNVEFLSNRAHAGSSFISILTAMYPVVTDIMSLVLAVFGEFNPFDCITTMTAHVCVVFVFLVQNFLYFLNS